MTTKFYKTFGWDKICFNPEKKGYEYWSFDNELDEHVFEHDLLESDFYDFEPELGDFEYIFSAEFPVL